jgi:hypothetical protein
MLIFFEKKKIREPEKMGKKIIVDFLLSFNSKLSHFDSGKMFNKFAIFQTTEKSFI